MKSTNGLKPRPPDRDIQSNISQHSCLQHAARVWPCCCDVLDVDSSLTIFKLELPTLNMSQKAQQVTRG